MRPSPHVRTAQYSNKTKYLTANLLTDVGFSNHLTSVRQFDEASDPHSPVSAAFEKPSTHTTAVSKTGTSCFKPILSNPFTCNARVEMELLKHALIYVTTTHTNSPLVLQGQYSSFPDH